LRGDPPAWVVSHPAPLTDTPADPSPPGGYSYLLADQQINIPAQQSFNHFAYRVSGSDGVQNMSDIDVEYDPSYQTLRFNRLFVHRDGRIIDSLANHEIQTFQREEGMDQNLYDGSLTALVNLENIRIGDVIEYSYTLTGFNPIHGDGYFHDLYLLFSLPVVQYKFRLLADKDQEIHFHRRNEAPAPDQRRVGDLMEYAWSLDDLPAHFYEANTPHWFDPLPGVKITTFDTWSQVADWALPHYRIDPAEADGLKTQGPDLSRATGLEDRILITLRFVQDELRYLGMEQGLGAYLPNPPLSVMERRFGDCKDKSLLLTALLRNLEVEAHPVLVNAYLQGKQAMDCPSPLEFDHCIVRFKHAGRDFFVDPTLTNQGGDLDHLSRLPYGRGLIIAEDTVDLTDLPAATIDTTQVSYHLVVQEPGEPASLTIRTTFRGPDANGMRDRFLNHSANEIGRYNLDYYSDAFPGIAEVNPPQVIDTGRDRDNAFIVEESYRIAEFWSLSDTDSNGFFAEVGPLEMREIADIPSSADRTAPYATGWLMDYTLEMTLEMPSIWPVEDDQVDIKGEAFTYHSSVSGDGNVITVGYHYRRLKESILPDQVTAHIQAHNRILDDLFFYLTYTPETEGFRPSRIVLILSGLFFLALVSGAVILHRRYDPVPLGAVPPALPIGGWLVLPAIGLVFSPFVNLAFLIGEKVYFDHDMWRNLWVQDGWATFKGLGLMLAFELAIRLMILVMSGFVLFQFFLKRSSLPRMMVAFLALTLLYPLLDLVGAWMILGSSAIEEVRLDLIQQIMRGVVSCAIWIPYFLVSKRVHNTFVVQRVPRAPDPLPATEPEDGISFDNRPSM